MAEAETLADRIGILDRGELLFLEPVDDVKERFGVETLEEAFFAATGRSFEEETDDDKDREVFADDRRSRSSRPPRADRARRRRRAQLVPRQALRLVGASRSSSGRREHAHDRLHREGRRRVAGRSQNELATKLLIGGVIWAYLGIIFEILTETVAWERWEGTIEYTFMAPLSRPVHLFGMGLFAVALRRRARERCSSP